MGGIMGPMIIRRTLLASFPRSGTHLTMDILRAYFGSHALKTVDSHLEPAMEYHGLIKCHDFDLTATPEQFGCERVIFQYREKEGAIDSWIKSAFGMPGVGSGEEIREAASEFYDRLLEKWLPAADIKIHYDMEFCDGIIHAAMMMTEGQSADDVNRLISICRAVDRRAP